MPRPPLTPHPLPLVQSDRVALAAKAAVEEGHAVTLFLAGDAVQLLRDAVLDHLAGLGTGRLRESYDAIVAGGGRLGPRSEAPARETPYARPKGSARGAAG